MSEANEVRVDPWLNAGERFDSLPRDAELVCAYDLFVAIDTVDEAAWLARAPARDELWIATEPAPGYGIAVSRPTQNGSDEQAALELLEVLFDARTGFGCPSDFRVPGLVDKAAYDALVAERERKLDEVSEEAVKGESEIVSSARVLKLRPEPTGTHPDRWRANCPGTQHTLQVDANTDLFYCGYGNRCSYCASHPQIAARHGGVR